MKSMLQPPTMSAMKMHGPEVESELTAIKYPVPAVQPARPLSEKLAKIKH